MLRDLPGVEAVVPAAGRAAGRHGRAPPRRRHDAPTPTRTTIPVRVDHYRNGPYDMLLTLSEGPHNRPDSPGSDAAHLQTPLPTAGASSVWTAARRPLSPSCWPTRTRPPAGPYALWATRRSTAGPSWRRKEELLAGDHTGVVWQQCGRWRGRGRAHRRRRIARRYPGPGGAPAGHVLLLPPGQTQAEAQRTLYPSGVQAAMPEPAEQLTPALSVQLTRAEKDALDLLAAWPLCTREQLAGLMGGVTLRRVNQVLRSLTQHGLVRTDEPLHMLTDEGLTYLARRDRAAVGLTLDRWSAEPLYLNADIYAGTAVRALASQMRHHSGVIDFAASPVRRGHPIPGPRPVRPAAHVPLQHRLSLRLDHLRHTSRRLFHPGLSKVDGVRTCWSSSDGPRRRNVPAPA